MNPDELVLYLRIAIKAELDNLKKVRRDTSGLGEDFEHTGKQADLSLRGVQMQLRSMISPIVMIRRTIFQLGTLWALTFGTIIAAVVSTQKQLEELNQVSLKSGQTVESVSKQIYGFNIATDSARNGVLALQEAQQGLSKLWTLTTKTITENIGNMKLQSKEVEIQDKRVKELVKTRQRSLAELQKEHGLLGGFFRYLGEQASPGALVKTDERINLQKEVHKEAIKQIEEERTTFNSSQKEAIILRGELSSKILEFQGRELDAFRVAMNAQHEIYVKMYGPDGKETKLFEQWVELQSNTLEKSKWGFKNYYQGIQELQKAFGTNTSKMFSDVFIDALDNKLANARDIFYTFFNDLRNRVIQFLMDQAVAQVFGYILRGVGNIVAGSNYSSGTGLSFSSWQNALPTQSLQPSAFGLGFAEGGWAGLNGPERVTVGEREPELIVPYSKLQSRSENKTTQNYFYINAIDSASFADVVSRNPNSIMAVVDRGLKQNKNLRKTIKNYS